MKYIKFKSPQEISKYAEENKKKLVIFDSYVLDVTTYA